MQHKTVKATATTQDQGIFSALAASYSVDRMGERIIPGAFGKTLEAWQTSGKNIPLHWDHEGSAASVIGYINPGSAKETDAGLYVEGQLDLENSEIAREAWRSMKNNAVSLSFGYLPTTRKGKDGVVEITEIDLFEISIVPAPANADTRLLSLKGAREAMGLPGDPADTSFPLVPERDPFVRQMRKALARLPHSDLPQDVKDRIAEKAQSILTDATKPSSAVEDGGDEEPPKAKSAPQDPLVKEAWDLIVPRHTPGPKREPEPEPEPLNAATVQNEAWALITQRHSAA